jgi:outer membrane lipoprotein LolB
VSVNPVEAVLTRSNGQTLTAASPDELIQVAIGEAIPVSGLRDWLRGRLSGQAASKASSVSRDAMGHLVEFIQDDWRVSLSKYDQSGPRFIAIKRDFADQQISIRLVID